MMKSAISIILLVLALILVAPAPASGTAIVSLVGDKDNGANGGSEPAGMDDDSYIDWPKSYTHNYALNGMTVASAWLQWHTQGVGSVSGFTSEVLVNGNVVWSRPGVDTCYLCPDEIVKVAVPLAYLNLNGIETVTAGLTGGDIVMLDYFELTLSDQSQVPEPGTWMMLGGGLAGLAWWRRRGA